MSWPLSAAVHRLPGHDAGRSAALEVCGSLSSTGRKLSNGRARLGSKRLAAPKGIDATVFILAGASEICRVHLAPPEAAAAVQVPCSIHRTEAFAIRPPHHPATDGIESPQRYKISSEGLLPIWLEATCPTPTPMPPS